nr:MAG TPA: hypothetical protein [Bacteriophage sp.]
MFYFLYLTISSIINYINQLYQSIISVILTYPYLKYNSFLR